MITYLRLLTGIRENIYTIYIYIYFFYFDPFTWFLAQGIIFKLLTLQKRYDLVLVIIINFKNIQV